MNRHRRNIFFCAAAGVMAIASAGNAQDCLKVTATPPKSTLTIERGTYTSAMAPGLYCGLDNGRSYRLTVSSPNHETRSLKFRLGSSGEPDFSGLRTMNVVRSMFLPGWGQNAMGNGGRGTLSFLWVVSSGLTVYQSWRAYDGERTTRTQYETAVSVASTPVVREALLPRLDLATRNTEAYRDNLTYTSIFAGWTYFANVFETMYIASPPSAKATGKFGAAVSIPQHSGFRAAMQSFVFPGMGQQYNGNPGKALFFGTAFVVSALMTIDRKLQYDLRRVEYGLAYRDFQEASSDPEKSAAQARATLLWNATEDRRRNMIGWGIATGGLWFLSLVDAAVAGGRSEENNRFDVGASYHSGAVWSGLTVRF